MTNEELIASLFYDSKLLGELLTVPVAYPGKKFTPPDTGRWIEISIASNDLQPDIDGAYVARRGIWQINACGRPDKDPTALYAMADDIAFFIVKGLAVGDTALTVTQNPTTGSLIVLDDRVILPITITYSE